MHSVKNVWFQDILNINHGKFLKFHEGPLLGPVKVPNGSNLFQKVPKGSKRLKKDPKGPERFQKVS